MFVPRAFGHLYRFLLFSSLSLSLSLFSLVPKKSQICNHYPKPPLKLYTPGNKDKSQTDRQTGKLKPFLILLSTTTSTTPLLFLLQQ